MNYNFLEAGRKGQFEKGSQVFNYFGGKYIGLFLTGSPSSFPLHLILS